MDQKAEAFRKFIEQEVLLIINKLVQQSDANSDKVQMMAQLTIDLIKPGMSLQELYQNAVKLDDKFPELAPVIIKLMREYEEKYEKKALDQVQTLIKSGHYDDAQDLVKKVLLFKIQN